MLAPAQHKALRKAIGDLDFTLPFTFDLEDIMDCLVRDYGTKEVVESAEEAAKRFAESRGLDL